MKHIRIWVLLPVFVLLVLGFFYQTLLYGKLPVPSDTLVGLYHPWRDAYTDTFPRGVPFKNFLITDPVRQQIPWKKIVIDSWKSGQRPGWNPYAFAGVPLDANIQAAPYYPLNLLFFLFDFPSAWTMLVMLQPLLAGILFFLYVRRFGVSGAASLTGAVVWAFCGFSVSWLTWGTIMQTALWLPLLLLSSDMLFAPRKTRGYYVRWAATLTAAAVMTVLAGHIQAAFYVLFVSVLYILWRFKASKNRTAAVWAASGLGAALIVTAIQWIPLMRFLWDSVRVAATESWKQPGWFLPWQHLIQFVVPDFFGNPATLNYWGIWNYGEFIGYIGVVPLMLALSALFAGGVTGFFAVMILTSLVFMLPNPVSSIPFLLHVPIISVMQPTRLMMIVDFSLAVLVAFGLDYLLKKDGKKLQRSILMTGITYVTLWGAVYVARFVIHDAATLEHIATAKRNLVLPTALFAGGLLWFVIFRKIKSAAVKKVWMWLLLCIIVADLFRFGWKFTPFTPREYFFPVTKTIEFLSSQKKPFRVMTLDDRILPPNVSAYYGIETIEGYDPVAPLLYEDFLVAGERGKADLKRPTGYNRIYTSRNIDSVLLPYFNVRYVLSLTDLSKPYLRLVMKEGETRVYEYTLGLPRVYLADTVITETKPLDVLSALFMKQPSLPGVYDGYASIMNVPLAASETADIIRYQPSEIRLQVTAANPRLLVVLNRFDARWRVTVDGKVSRAFPVNFLFTGVAVPVGTHDVRLIYR